ncbi:hypothetical protein Tco_0307361 [Tanacetum coccineum]
MTKSGNLSCDANKPGDKNKTIRSSVQNPSGDVEEDLWSNQDTRISPMHSLLNDKEGDGDKQGDYYGYETNESDSACIKENQKETAWNNPNIFVSVWVKMHKVPIVAYCEDGLSLIATQVGKPIMLDAFTSEMCADPWGRLGYARALVECPKHAIYPKDASNGTNDGFITVNIRKKKGKAQVLLQALVDDPLNQLPLCCYAFDCRLWKLQLELS